MTQDAVDELFSSSRNVFGANGSSAADDSDRHPEIASSASRANGTSSAGASKNGTSMSESRTYQPNAGAVATSAPSTAEALRSYDHRDVFPNGPAGGLGGLGMAMALAVSSESHNDAATTSENTAGEGVAPTSANGATPAGTSTPQGLGPSRKQNVACESDLSLYL
jgi:hypothetical protein